MTGRLERRRTTPFLQRIDEERCLPQTRRAPRGSDVEPVAPRHDRPPRRALCDPARPPPPADRTALLPFDNPCPPPAGYLAARRHAARPAAQSAMGFLPTDVYASVVSSMDRAVHAVDLLDCCLRDGTTAGFLGSCPVSGLRGLMLAERLQDARTCPSRCAAFLTSLQGHAERHRSSKVTTFWLGLAYAANHMPNQARRAFAELDSLFFLPGNADFLLACCALSGRWPTRALEHAQRCLRQQPVRPAAIELMARAHYVSGDYPAAARLLGRLSTCTDAGLSDATCRSGLRVAALILHDRLPSAETILLDELRQRPRQGLLHFLLGELLCAYELFAPAAAHLGAAVGLQPSRAAWQQRHFLVARLGSGTPPGAAPRHFRVDAVGSAC